MIQRRSFIQALVAIPAALAGVNLRPRGKQKTLLDHDNDTCIFASADDVVSFPPHSRSSHHAFPHGKWAMPHDGRVMSVHGCSGVSINGNYVGVNANQRLIGARFVAGDIVEAKGPTIVMFE